MMAFLGPGHGILQWNGRTSLIVAKGLGKVGKGAKRGLKALTHTRSEQFEWVGLNKINQLRRCVIEALLTMFVYIFCYCELDFGVR
jgi:hypothetical protein